jgi:endoglucanase
MNSLKNSPFICAMVVVLPVMAQRPYIMVDQFGYRPADEKIAVLADPLIGFNASDNYTPGERLQVRRLKDNAVVFSGHSMAWKDGITQESSGDRGWWFDFSDVTNPGQYSIYDELNQAGSYPFTISENVYYDLLKAASCICGVTGTTVILPGLIIRRPAL